MIPENDGEPDYAPANGMQQKEKVPVKNRKFRLILDSNEFIH